MGLAVSEGIKEVILSYPQFLITTWFNLTKMELNFIGLEMEVYGD